MLGRALQFSPWSVHRRRRLFDSARFDSSSYNTEIVRCRRRTCAQRDVRRLHHPVVLKRSHCRR